MWRSPTVAIARVRAHLRISGGQRHLSTGLSPWRAFGALSRSSSFAVAFASLVPLAAFSVLVLRLWLTTIDLCVFFGGADRIFRCDLLDVRDRGCEVWKAAAIAAISQGCTVRRGSPTRLRSNRRIQP